MKQSALHFVFFTAFCLSGATLNTHAEETSAIQEVKSNLELQIAQLNAETSQSIIEKLQKHIKMRQKKQLKRDKHLFSIISKKNKQASAKTLNVSSL